MIARRTLPNGVTEYESDWFTVTVWTYPRARRWKFGAAVAIDGADVDDDKFESEADALLWASALVTGIAHDAMHDAATLALYLEDQ